MSPPDPLTVPQARRGRFGGRASVVVLGVLAVLCAAVGVSSRPAHAQGGCSTTFDAEPTAVDVVSVPIVVASTTDDYFVLYASHTLDGASVDMPVLVKRGEAGTTTLAENVAALAAERYRVEKYSIADPADVDGDCTDDITELDNFGAMNPVNPGHGIASLDDAAAVLDRSTFEALSKALVLKFVVVGMHTDRPSVYFANTNTYQAHQSYLDALGIDRDAEGAVTGSVFSGTPGGTPDGSQELYRFDISVTDLAHYSFNSVERIHSLLVASMPLLDDDLVFHIRQAHLRFYQEDLPMFRESRIGLVFDEHVYSGSEFLSLNPGVGFGLLRVMDPGERPNPRDVVVYESLPNELPRVAGIVSMVPQTPLSHVNLRAVQDGVPNAYVRDAATRDKIQDLVGSYVRYEVTEDGWDMRAATPAEVDAHHASSRPAFVQVPQRDLSVTSIKPLGEVGFGDWTAFGVKAANVAVLGSLGLPEGTVPDGFAIPFYFYDEFMKHNGFYGDVAEMLADSEFQTDFNTQVSDLEALREAIEDADTPQWIIDALVVMNESFDAGINRRYRSSTNNEDLPNFSGAGLYDSKSQKPSEDEDDLAKSLKEVYAGLWNYRAFREREFHRVDHLKTAMGVLVHPSYQDEKVNGVAVSYDPIQGREHSYYINSQVGEDLVTNPEAASVPEEILMSSRSDVTFSILGTSNQVEPGQLLMTGDRLALLRRHLGAIHDRFEQLYDPAPGEPFAMEIEFKITSDDILAIKQARPWVFYTGPPVVTKPVITRPVITRPVITRPVTGPPAPAVATGPDPVIECPSEGASHPFTDVAHTSSINDAVACVYELKVTTGTTPTTYSPADDVTRAEMAAFLSRLHTAITGDTPPVVDTPFTDIAGSSARDHIARVYGLGITGGTTATTYSPAADVTRAQMAAFLSRLYTAITGVTAPVVDTPFTDIADSSARDHIARVYGLGITGGTTATTYSPAADVTRAQMAAFLSRLHTAVTGDTAVGRSAVWPVRSRDVTS